MTNDPDRTSAPDTRQPGPEHGISNAPPAPVDAATIQLPVRATTGQDTTDSVPLRPPRDTTGSSPADDATVRQSESGDHLVDRSTPESIRYFGDYELISEIARGGMGVVYKARQVNLHRVVALKMILAGQLASDEDVKRFYTEAEAAAALEHPGIVPIFEIGRHNDQHFFSMGFVDGGSLADKVKDRPLPSREAAIYTKKVAEAIAYAHSKGVIHRDLKPANVLLDRNDEPKVTDFGLARRAESNSDLTHTGAVMGTPSYMPPEQAAGKADEVGPLADVYTLGAILYCLLTGRPPFQASNPLDTLMQVLDREPASVTTLNPAVQRDLDTICHKCLQKAPAKRYGSAQEFADDLGRWLNGEPIQARAVSTAERVWRWCRRNPKIAALSATAVLFIALTAVMSSWAWVVTSAQASQIAVEKKKVEEQRDEAERQRAAADQQKAKAEDNEQSARDQANLALESFQYVLFEIDSRLRMLPGVSEARIALLDSMSKKWDEIDLHLTGGIRGEAIPTLMALRYNLGTAYVELDRLSEADREFSRVYQMTAERIDLQGRTVGTLSNRAKLGLVWASVKKRLRFDPAAATTLLEEAESLSRECLADTQTSDTTILVDLQKPLAAILQDKGVEYLHQGRLSDTEKCFSESLRKNWRTPPAMKRT